MSVSVLCFKYFLLRFKILFSETKLYSIFLIRYPSSITKFEINLMISFLSTMSGMLLNLIMIFYFKCKDSRNVILIRNHFK